ncbi:MAG: argininosuccinate lyase [bacterium]
MYLWSGKEDLYDIVKTFTYSISEDKELFYFDIVGSIAHTLALYRGGIVSLEEAKAIVEGLKRIEKVGIQDIYQYEDIHTAIEMTLTSLIGESAKKMHTARSRNDQVALDERLYLRDKLKETLESLRALIKAFIDLSVASLDIVFPGFTHLQPAQPVLLAHHLLAYVEMLKRDFSRFYSLFPRINECPLGSGALAGLDFPYDRTFVSELLRFDKPTDNSMDTVCDRDYLLEYAFDATLLVTHLSRFGEEIVLWSNPSFSFVKIASGYTTGSSMMPQKRNPDVAELIRGEAGEFLGYLTSIFNIMKGLPLTYNRDLQLDKKAIFKVSNTLLLILETTRGLIEHIEFDRDSIEHYLKKTMFLLATDIADFLVNKGVPFREAHHIVQEIVNYCQKENKDFSFLSKEEWNRFGGYFTELEPEFFQLEKSISRRNTYGGTSREQIEYQIIINRKWLEESRKYIDKIPQIKLEEISEIL